jgi:hypothetical protein
MTQLNPAKGIFCVALLFALAIPARATPSIDDVVYGPDPVGTYEKFEIVVDLTASYENPFNPDEIDLSARFVSPTAVEWSVWGFFDGSDWKVRFSTNEVGTWEFRVVLTDSTGVDSSDVHTFQSTLSGEPGWLRGSPLATHYLCHEDGTSFFGIGQCRCWQLDQVPTIFQDMEEHGMNFLAYWLPHWDNMLVTMETGYDHYDMEHAANVDDIVDSCETYGIYLMLTVWNHDELRGPPHPWGGNAFYEYNPFSLLTDAEHFFVDDTSWAYQKKLYRYMIARWSHSRALGMWQTICEINGTNAYGNTNYWHGRINGYFVSNDPFSHPTTADKSGDVWWSSGYSVMDVPQVHTYDHANDEIGIADRIAYWTDRMWDNYDKPNVIGEFGTSNESLQPMHLHNGIWAGLASGGSITPLDWNDGGNWGDFSPEMFDHCGYMADFLADLRLDRMGLSPSTCSVNSGREIWGMNSDTSGLFWIQDLTPGNTNYNVNANLWGLDDGEYEFLYFDPWNGVYLDTLEEEVSGGFVSASVPSFVNDVACKFQPVSAAPSQNVTDFEAAPGNARVNLSWVNPDFPAFEGVKIVRKAWNGYPEYSGSGPGYPVGHEDGTTIYIGAGTSFVDLDLDRDVYFYGAFAFDSLGNYVEACSTAEDRATSYFLGDFDGDGLENLSDLVVFSNCFATDTTSPYWNPECDIGPTDTGERFGIPEPDGCINFEDLMIFAMNYQNVPLGRISRTFVVRSSPEPVRVLDDTGTILLAPADTSVMRNDTFRIRLEVDENIRDLKVFSVRVHYDPGLLELVSVTEGDLFPQAGPSFFWWGPFEPDTVQMDGAVLGPGLSADGPGVLACLEFTATDTGTTEPVPTDVYLRDVDNLDIPFTVRGASIHVGPEAVTESGWTPGSRALDLRIEPNVFERSLRMTVFGEDGPVSLSVFDVRGRKALDLGPVQPSERGETVRWSGRDSKGAVMPNGLYFIVMQSENEPIVRIVRTVIKLGCPSLGRMSLQP